MKKLLFLLLFAATELKAQPPVLNIEALAREEMTSAVARGGGSYGESMASDNFDVKYYRGEWEVDPNVRYIKGKLTVYFKLTSAATSITMDLMNALTVDSVKQRGSHLSYSQTLTTLPINFSGNIAGGTLDSLTVFYKGIPANTGFGSFIRDIHASVPVIWTLSEPYGSRDWWPCKNNINDKADSLDVIITHPSQYKAASNGVLQSETPLGNGFTATHWKHRYPISSYLVCLAVTNYATFNNSVQLGSVNLPVTTHCFPENKTVWEAQTPLVLEALKLFHDSIGEYPFIREKYGHVQFNWGGGMEHQTSTFLQRTDESLMAHELAHQWFGDKITAASWEDIWLNEGFATHMAYWHFEKKYPAATINYKRNIVLNVTASAGGSVRVTDTSSLSQIFSSRLSYNKGSHLLYMLRWILSDAVFFDGIRQYVRDPAVVYGNATTADLKRNLEQRSGKDLTYFFDQWYRGEGYPIYYLKWNTIGSGSVRFSLNQITSHPSVSFFKLPVPLLFKNATQQKMVVADNTFNGQTFIKDLGFVPDTVIIDPEYWLISNFNQQTKLPSVNSGLGQADIFPNPIAGPLTVYLHDFNAGSATVMIFNKSGQRMYSRNISLVNGSEYLQIATGNWARGTYTVQIKAGNKTIVKQVLR